MSGRFPTPMEGLGPHQKWGVSHSPSLWHTPAPPFPRWPHLVHHSQLPLGQGCSPMSSPPPAKHVPPAVMDSVHISPRPLPLRLENKAGQEGHTPNVAGTCWSKHPLSKLGWGLGEGRAPPRTQFHPKPSPEPGGGSVVACPLCRLESTSPAEGCRECGRKDRQMLPRRSEGWLCLEESEHVTCQASPSILQAWPFLHKVSLFKCKMRHCG